MEGVSVRLLPFAIADGPHNMAADEVLLHSAADRHVASLRFYGWSPATLSLGYFQSAAVRCTDSLLAELPWVRRASGGAALVHDRELTYALALPPGPPWHSGESWLSRMHRIIAAALRRLGITKPITLVDTPHTLGDILCFQKQTPNDVTCGGSKIVGSAQRKHRHGLLQHGGVLLAQSRFAPQLPGLLELTGSTLSAETLSFRIGEVLAGETGWNLANDSWTESECRLIEKISMEKYSSPAWNEKR